MMAAYALHAQRVTASTANMTAATATCGRLADQLVDTVRSVDATVQADRGDLEANIAEQSRQAVDRLTDGIRRCETTVASLKSNASSVEETVADYVAEAGNRMESFEAAAKDSLATASAAKAVFVEKFGEKSQEAAARLAADAAAINGGIEKNIRSDEQVTCTWFSVWYSCSMVDTVGTSVVDPDPHHFGNLNPQQFSDDKPKCVDYAPILALFQGFEVSLLFESDADPQHWLVRVVWGPTIPVLIT